MAKYCCDECIAVCDFCKHYIDDSDKNEGEPFAGEGICLKKNKRVDASNYCLDDFECFSIK